MALVARPTVAKTSTAVAISTASTPSESPRPAQIASATAHAAAKPATPQTRKADSRRRLLTRRVPGPIATLKSYPRTPRLRYRPQRGSSIESRDTQPNADVSRAATSDVAARDAVPTAEGTAVPETLRGLLRLRADGTLPGS